ncbi:acetylglutamate kinase [Paenibacillus hubeiensis]|uniref:acetylglutamate kinase n=1 Tax=Paenibacillus hubeiensis TaxID=3077330 RepID=UPI001F86DD2E|nr:Acetylglutamate kinase [Paenibacillus sp. JJ-223]
MSSTTLPSEQNGARTEAGKQRFVMKCGGSTLAALPESFFADLRDLQAQGIQPVIVHGGGPAISDNLAKLGIETEFVNGLRKTTEAVLDVVEMVLAGSINKQIVRLIQRVGGRAIGLSGVDGGLIQARPVTNHAEIGWVGEVTGVEAPIIQGVVDMGYMPVIAPVGVDVSGQRYNINADTAAGAVASHLGVSRMIVVTDVPGIMKTVRGEKKVLPSVSVQEIEDMIQTGEIYGGMIPKVRAAIACIHGDVREVVIVDGSEPQILSRVLGGEAIGTRIIRMP